MPRDTTAAVTPRHLLAAAAGLVGVAGATAGLAWLMVRQARQAQAEISSVLSVAPEDSGRYGEGDGDAHRIALLGDSTARGVAAGSRHRTLGGVTARTVAWASGRPVDLVNVAINHSTSEALSGQIDTLITRMPHPHLAIIVVGPNDITHRVPVRTSARCLTDAVTRLRATGAEVIVCTCPDLGTVRPIREPLRTFARLASRRLARAQTVAALEAGARTISLVNLLGAPFRTRPDLYFSADNFHPSARGYVRAAATIAPSVLDALDIRDDQSTPPMRRRDLAGIRHLARVASRWPGTEVVPFTRDGLRSLRYALRLRRGPMVGVPTLVMPEPDTQERSQSRSSNVDTQSASL